MSEETDAITLSNEETDAGSNEACPDARCNETCPVWCTHKLTRVDLNLNRINPMFVNGVSSGYTKVNEAIERESELFVIATL